MKTILKLILISMMLLTLIACSKSESNQKDEETETKDSQTSTLSSQEAFAKRSFEKLMGEYQDGNSEHFDTLYLTFYQAIINSDFKVIDDKILELAQQNLSIQVNDVTYQEKNKEATLSVTVTYADFSVGHNLIVDKLIAGETVTGTEVITAYDEHKNIVEQSTTVILILNETTNEWEFDDDSNQDFTNMMFGNMINLIKDFEEKYMT